MTYRGKVQHGVVVLEDAKALADGTEVRVERIDADQPALSESLLKLAGRAKGLPNDASRNHDHYLYGTPKR